MIKFCGLNKLDVNPKKNKALTIFCNIRLRFSIIRDFYGSSCYFCLMFLSLKACLPFNAFLFLLPSSLSTRQLTVLSQAGYDLSSISFFQRSTAQEFITFTARILTERTALGARQSVKEAEYYCHVFVRADGLSGVCFSDHEYPPRVAHTVLMRVLDDFAGR